MINNFEVTQLVQFVFEATISGITFQFLNTTKTGIDTFEATFIEIEMIRVCGPYVVGNARLLQFQMSRHWCPSIFIARILKSA